MSFESRSGGDFSYCWAELIIEECVRYGVTRFCVAPGSRSSYLTMAAARHASCDVMVHVDERGLGFVALGIARGDASPVGVIVTSGTAVANLLPSIVEAFYSRVPLVLLTADRPQHLVGTGVNQTINQQGLFRQFVVAESQLPLPDLSVSPQDLLSHVGKVVSKMQAPVSGPVHLNVPFNTPFSVDHKESDITDYLEGLDSLQTGNQHLLTPFKGSDLGDFDGLASCLAASQGDVGSAVIVVGTLNSQADRDAVLRFSEAVNWPIMADVTSQLRLVDHPLVVPYYEQFLGDVDDDQLPEVVFWIGDYVCSKPLLSFVKRCERVIQLVDHQRCMDPGSCITSTFVGPIGDGCLFLASKSDSFSQESTWMSLFLLRAEEARTALLERFDTHVSQLDVHDLNGVIASQSALVHGLSAKWAGHTVMVGNSGPIRFLNAFGPLFESDKAPFVMANRGASGIDGVLATACGISLAKGEKVILLLGDVSGLHDLNSFLLLKKPGVDVLVVVINNSGGRLFSLLPVADQKDVMDTYFCTVHEYDFESIGRMSGVPYIQATSYAKAMSEFDVLAQQRGSSVLELKVSEVDMLESSFVVLD